MLSGGFGLPHPFDGVLDGVASVGLPSVVPESLHGLGRQAEVLDDALSLPLSYVQL